MLASDLHEISVLGTILTHLLKPKINCDLDSADITVQDEYHRCSPAAVLKN